jgi:hypothetical protein
VPGDGCFDQWLVFVAETPKAAAIIEKKKISGFDQELLL